DLRRLSSWTSAGAGVDKRLLQDLETPGEIVVVDDQRDEDADHVAVRAAREEDQASLSGVRGRLLGELRGRLLALAVGDELEGEHRAEAAHLADLVDAARDLVQPRAQVVAELLGVRAELVLGDLVEHRYGRRAGNRVSAERSAEAAGLGSVHDLG